MPQLPLVPQRKPSAKATQHADWGPYGIPAALSPLVPQWSLWALWTCSQPRMQGLRRSQVAVSPVWLLLDCCGLAGYFSLRMVEVALLPVHQTETASWLPGAYQARRLKSRCAETRALVAPPILHLVAIDRAVGSESGIATALWFVLAADQSRCLTQRSRQHLVALALCHH